MPITLTTPKDVGDLDTSDYTTVKIIDVNTNSEKRAVRFTHLLGYMDGDDFVHGKLPKEMVELIGDDINPIVSVMGAADENLWDHGARAGYQYLLDQGIYVGSIT